MKANEGKPISVMEEIIVWLSPGPKQVVEKGCLPPHLNSAMEFFFKVSYYAHINTSKIGKFKRQSSKTFHRISSMRSR